MPEHLEPRSQIEILQGDILMTCAGPRNRCGVACLVTKTRPRLMMSGKMYRFRPNPEVLDANYLSLFIRLHDTQLKIDAMKTGINDSGLNLTHSRFSGLPVVVAPLSEQRRIVERIEAMFDEIDHGVENLKKARATLGLYRQSLLKSAFEGHLTADWRARNAALLEPPETLLARIQKERDARYKSALDDWQKALTDWRENGEQGKKPSKPKRPDQVDPLSPEQIITLPELPCEWAWVKVGQIFSVYVGSTPSRKKASFWNGDVPWVSSGEVHFNRISVCKEYLTGEGFDNMSGEIHPEGTVMLGMIGEGKTRGQAAILDMPATHNQNCAAIRVSETDIPPELVYEFFRFRYEDTRKMGSGNNQKALNKTRVQDMPFPICSPEEQAEIIRILDERVSAADALETEIDAGLTRAEALRQSILKQAFSGKLVPQDPKDEPAANLLARIKAEKASKPKKRRAANA